MRPAQFHAAEVRWTEGGICAPRNFITDELPLSAQAPLKSRGLRAGVNIGQWAFVIGRIHSFPIPSLYYGLRNLWGAKTSYLRKKRTSILCKLSEHF
jgi:hypothetical protein